MYSEHIYLTQQAYMYNSMASIKLLCVVHAIQFTGHPERACRMYWCDLVYFAATCSSHTKPHFSLMTRHNFLLKANKATILLSPLWMTNCWSLQYMCICIAGTAYMTSNFSRRFILVHSQINCIVTKLEYSIIHCVLRTCFQLSQLISRIMGWALSAIQFNNNSVHWTLRAWL